MLQVVVHTCLMGIKLGAVCSPVLTRARSVWSSVLLKEVLQCQGVGSMECCFICLRLPALPIRSPGWLLQWSQSLLVV